MTFTDPTLLDRFWSSFRALVRLALAQRALLGTYEYRIVASDGTTVDCVPTDASVGLPALNKLPMQSAVDGITATPPTGGFCRVVFLNGDRSKPRVVGCDGPCTSVSIGPAPQPLATGPATSSLVTALTAFATGLTPANLSTNAGTLVTALGTIAPTVQTTGTKAT
jgi:hypothetical protein